MANVSLSPVFNAWQGFTSAGLPLSGGFINTYLAGTSTPQVTYTSSAGTVANATAIQLGPDGRPPFEIWLVVGIAYKFVVTDSLGLNALTFDSIVGIGDAGNFGTLTVSGNSVLGATAANTLNVGNGTLVTDANGNVGLGVTPTPGAGLLQMLGSANGGVKLGNVNNASPTALDWYEEGTWSIQLQAGGANVGMVNSGNAGKFTRIGNVVTFEGTASYTANNFGTSTGVMTLAGLPYPVNALNVPCTVNMVQLQSALVGIPAAVILFGTTNIGLYDNQPSGANTQLTNTKFGALVPATITVSGTYIV